MNVSKFVVLLGVFACVPVCQAIGQDAIGPLGDVVDQQLVSGWQAGSQDGWFVLRNETLEGSEQTLVINAGPPPADGRHIAVNVSLNSSVPEASIGVLTRNADSGDLCLMEITAEAAANLFCVIGGEHQAVASVANAARMDGSDIIEMIEVPGSARFLVNGAVIGDVDYASALGSELGIMAYERGTFGLADFAIADLPASAGSGAAGGSGLPPKGGKAAGDGGTTADESAEAPLPMFGNDQNKLIGVYLGLTNGIFMHEFGHALIGELQVPSTGPEEDAVDIFSALRVVEPTMYPSGDPDIDTIGRNVALYSALPWYYGGLIGEQNGATTPWQDEHTGDLKRFRNVFCVIYGGNPGLYGSIAEEAGLDERTLGRCEEEFNRQNRAWRTILSPYTRVGTWHPEGLLPADAPGAGIEVVFEPSRTRVGQFLVEAFGDSIKGFADDLATTYALPRPLKVIYRDCDELNAWYSPEEASITMCYDLIDNLAVMISDVEMGTQGGMDVGAAPEAGSAGKATSAGVDVASGGGSGAIDEMQEFGVPPTSVLFPAPYRGPTPAGHAKAKILTTPELVDLMNQGSAMLLIDTSGQAQTIPSALSVTDAGKDGSLTDGFQAVVESWLEQQTENDKALPIIFFGAGLQDRSSYNAALRAGTLGWNVFWYRGGSEAWQSNGLELVTQE